MRFFPYLRVATVEGRQALCGTCTNPSIHRLAAWIGPVIDILALARLQTISRKNRQGFPELPTLTEWRWDCGFPIYAALPTSTIAHFLLRLHFQCLPL